jgi:hypothetical protein
MKWCEEAKVTDIDEASFAKIRIPVVSIGK